jgi:hypothetical protein
VEPETIVGKLKLLKRFVGQSGRAVWECRCGCRRMVTVDESRLNGEHPRQARSCRSCESGQPAEDDTPEPVSADSGEARPVSEQPTPPAANIEPIEADELSDISPLELRGRAEDGRFLVRCKCGHEFTASKRILTGAKRIKRCAECVK